MCQAFIVLLLCAKRSAKCWTFQGPRGASCAAANPLQVLPWGRPLGGELSENCLLFVILTPVINRELLLLQGALASIISFYPWSTRTRQGRKRS